MGRRGRKRTRGKARTQLRAAALAYLLVLLLLGPRRHVAPQAVRHPPARAVASRAAAWD